MEPAADRPRMPGYGIEPASPSGLLAWSWAEERLVRSHDYWFASVRPDARPHVMPVWGVVLEGAFWCSTSPASRKASNLRVNPAVTVTTDDASEPVVVEGVATIATDDAAVARFAAAMVAKYRNDAGLEFYAANLTVQVAPQRVIGIDTGAFTTSPTRWRF
jgi:PPOX class probable F420-dependent enzyme